MSAYTVTDAITDARAILPSLPWREREIQERVIGWLQEQVQESEQKPDPFEGVCL